MNNQVDLQLPLVNRGSRPVKLYLEPIPAYYILEPGQEATIHSIDVEGLVHKEFILEFHDSFIMIYTPGVQNQLISKSSRMKEVAPFDLF